MSGVTGRHLFDAMSMHALMRRPNLQNIEPTALAKDARRWSDAMVAERANGNDADGDFCVIDSEGWPGPPLSLEDAIKSAERFDKSDPAHAPHVIRQLGPEVSR